MSWTCGSGHRVESVEAADGNFIVHTRNEQGIAAQFAAKKIAVATGYYDLPNRLGIPGEDLPHVSHYYTEPHPFWRQNVVVIGGKNSAAEAALDLYRTGANVTMVHRKRGTGLHDQVLGAPGHRKSDQGRPDSRAL